MKAFIVVSLVCCLGAASAGLTSPAVQLGKTVHECKNQAYLEVLNCSGLGFKNGTADIQCLSVVVLNYINCLEETDQPLLPKVKPPLLGASLSNIVIPSIEKIQCIFNNVLDTLKCIVDGHLQAGILAVNWPVIIKCLVTNMPALLVCFPQGIW